MKAISFAGPRAVRLVEIDEPDLGPEDVLIDVHFVGLCGSDLNTYRGLMPLVQYPRIPGHEIAGVILDKGPAVPDSIHIGAQITVSPYTSCGVCPACRAGRTNCCQYNETYGVQRDGAMTSRLATHYSKIFGSEVLSLQELALVEPLSVGYHAANRGRVNEMDTVMVIGAGTIGIGAIAAAARKGARVIVVDIDEGKLAQARKYGAAYTINSTQTDVRSRLYELTNDEGVSVAIEAVGLPQTYRLAVDAVSFAGRIVFIGYAKSEVCFDTTQFVKKELDILGARNALRVFPAVIEMLEQRQRPFTDLITRVYPLAQTGDALRDWEADPGAFAKIQIDVKSDAG